MNQLVRYDAMCRAIAAAYEVDEVKDIRDKARALEVYARQAKNTEAERQACEIRLRAERRCGKLLKEIEKAKGARGNASNQYQKAVPSGDFRAPKHIADYGLSYDQSSRFQQLADVPEDEFEAALQGDKPTASGIIAAHAAKPKPKNVVDDETLWLWGCLCDFERDGLLKRKASEMVASMLPHMQETTRRLAPIIAAWLKEIT